jgi:hypothetical protein
MPGAQEFQSESMRVISSMKWHCVIWVVGCRPRGRAVRRCSHLLASGWFTHPFWFVLILPSSLLLVATNVSRACCVHFAVDTTIPWCTCSSSQQCPTAYHTCCSVVASCRGLGNTLHLQMRVGCAARCRPGHGVPHLHSGCQLLFTFKLPPDCWGQILPPSCLGLALDG